MSHAPTSNPPLRKIIIEIPKSPLGYSIRTQGHSQYHWSHTRHKKWFTRNNTTYGNSSVPFVSSGTPSDRRDSVARPHRSPKTPTQTRSSADDGQIGVNVGGFFGQWYQNGAPSGTTCTFTRSDLPASRCTCEVGTAAPVALYKTGCLRLCKKWQQLWCRYTVSARAHL